MHTTTTNRIARLVLGSVISLSSAVQAQSPNAPTHFDITLTAGDAVIKPDPLLPGAVTVKEAGAQNGAPTDTRVGLPNLSVRELDYLLPYTASFEGLDLELVSETVELIGTFDVAPNPAPEARFLLEGPQTYTYVADGVQLDDDGRDVAAYSGQLAYPATPVEVASVGEQRAARPGHRDQRTLEPARFPQELDQLAEVSVEEGDPAVVPRRAPRRTPLT